MYIESHPLKSIHGWGLDYPYITRGRLVDSGHFASFLEGFL